MAEMLIEDYSLSVGFGKAVVAEVGCVSASLQGMRKQDRPVSPWKSEMVGGGSWDDAAAGFGLANT